MKKETGKEWLHGRRKRIAVVVVLAAAGAIAWLLLSLFSGAKEVGFEPVSYTPLAVYKRQRQSIIPAVFFAKNCCNVFV